MILKLLKQLYLNLNMNYMKILNYLDRIYCMLKILLFNYNKIIYQKMKMI